MSLNTTVTKQDFIKNIDIEKFRQIAINNAYDEACRRADCPKCKLMDLLYTVDPNLDIAILDILQGEVSIGGLIATGMFLILEYQELLQLEELMKDD